jgi:hypothetical protein
LAEDFKDLPRNRFFARKPGRTALITKESTPSIYVLRPDGFCSWERLCTPQEKECFRILYGEHKGKLYMIEDGHVVPCFAPAIHTS